MMYADPKYAMKMTVLFFKSDSPSGIFSFILYIHPKIPRFFNLRDPQILRP